MCFGRENFFLSEEENIARFSLSDCQLNELTDRLGQYIAHPTRKNYALNADEQVSLSLRFLASGSDYRLITDAHGVSKSTHFSTVHRFVDAVNDHLYFDSVKFPEDVQATVDGFRNRGESSARKFQSEVNAQ